MNTIQDPITTISDPCAIHKYRLLALHKMLLLETLGMTGRVAAGPLVRASTGLKAKNKKVLLRDYEQWLTTQGIMVKDA